MHKAYTSLMMKKNSALQDALHTAAHSKPRVYRLIRESVTDDLLVANFGCQGNAKGTQEAVAKLIQDTSQTRKPDFLFLLGDNFYDFGVESPDDPMFKTHFEDIYKGIPCFVVLGNHDYFDLHKKGQFILSKKNGIEIANNQIAYSYYQSGANIEEKKVFYHFYDNEDDDYPLNTNKLPHWNLPHRFYSVIDEKSNTQFFFIDSNRYAKDYIAACQANHSDPSNQATWLVTETKKAKASNRKTILISHHPINYTPGKRAFNADGSIYLSTAEISLTQELVENSSKTQPDILANHNIKKENKPKNVNHPLSLSDGFIEKTTNDFHQLSYNEILNRIIHHAQQLSFDLEINAHDHSIYKYTNTHSKTNQIVTGGGGGNLQNIYHHGRKLDCYIKDHGYVATFYKKNDPKIVCDFHAINRLHLRFNHNENEPIYDTTPNKFLNANDIAILKAFKNAVLKGIEEYFKFIHEKQTKHQGNFYRLYVNVTHSHQDIIHANQIKNRFNAYSSQEYTLTDYIIFMRDIFKLKKTSAHGLETLINKELQQQLGKNLKSFCEENTLLDFQEVPLANFSL